MPEEPTRAEDGILRRKVRQRRLLFLVAVGLAVIAAIVVTVVLVNRHDDSGSAANEGATPGVTDVTSPYDFSELPADSGLNNVKRASYVSVLLIDESGKLTSYGINSSLPAAQALLKAVGSADEVDSATLITTGPGSSTISGAGSATSSTLTFVFPDRSTLTYALYPAQGLIVRDARAWKPEGNLQELVQAIVTVGQAQTPAKP